MIYGIDNMPEDPKVLVIGAGGIGCELLKTLAMTGFKNIEVIDLDTIDISNLNRQFLFTREDVGKSKSEVAANAIKNRFPEVNIKSYVGNIKDAQFRSEFFKSFDIIFNALDNIEARKHVSRVCIALNKPLIDGGSTGFIGTTVSIIKDKTPCYECIDKPTPKQFPVCTIRSTPDKMIHCIVWAKLLLSALFGPQEESNFLEDIRVQLAETVKNNDPKVLAHTIFSKVYDSDIKDQLLLIQKKEDPANEEDKEVIEKLANRRIRALDSEAFLSMYGLAGYLDENANRDDKQVWEVEKYAQLFFSTIDMIMTQYSSKFGHIEFDKDDELLLDFVISASNLRAYNYFIQLESGFKIKEIAGNIVPAVSSTNGLVAGLETIEGLKVLAGKYDDLKAVTFASKGEKRKINSTTIANDINPNCIVCSNVSLQTKLTVDPDTFKLEDLINKIFYKELAISSASVEANSNIIFESGDDLDEDEKEVYESKLPKLLKDIGITAGTTLYVDDYHQDFKCYIEVQFIDKEAGEKLEHDYSFIKLNSGTLYLDPFPLITILKYRYDSFKRQRSDKN